jgi:hypothetical protein
LILPAVIALEKNGMRFVIAGVATLILAGAIAFSKRPTQLGHTEDDVPREKAPVPAD